MICFFQASALLQANYTSHADRLNMIVDAVIKRMASLSLIWRGLFDSWVFASASLVASGEGLDNGFDQLVKVI
jgi:hypothetical protein